MIQIHEIIKKQLAIAGAEEYSRTSENGKAGVGEGTVGVSGGSSLRRFTFPVGQVCPTHTAP